MKLALVLFPACLAAQAALDSLVGTWVPQQETNGIARFVIRKEQSRTIAQAWGKCTPDDCDWGEADIELWNGFPVAIFEHGYAVTHIQFVRVPDGRLVVAHEREYQDGSNRHDPGHSEFYIKQEEGPDSAAARDLLRKTADAYRSLPASRFESVDTETRITANSEARSVTRSTLWSQPPNKIRIETKGGREDSIEIADGEVEWRIFPDAHEYMSTPQAKNAPLLSPLRQFTLLDTKRGDPRIAGHETLDGTPCTVVQIGIERGVDERLWLDDETHLVRKILSQDGPSRSEVLYFAIHLGEEASSDAFLYDPAAVGARHRRATAHSEPESMTGKPAPDFTLRDLDGREVHLSELRGKPVLLDFWATWCGYCRQALPSVELLHRSLKDKLAVFGVDDEAPEVAREYLQKFGYTLPSLVDPNDRAVNLFHLGGWPTTILIDREGKIVFYEVGFESEKLRDALRAADIW